MKKLAASFILTFIFIASFAGYYGGGSSITTPVSVANGGTNSSTALANSKVMVSSGGAVVESATTTTNLGTLDTSTSLTTQLAAKAARPGDSFGRCYSGYSALCTAGLSGSEGYGTTDTVIRRYASSDGAGSDVSIALTAASGCVATINTTGLYWIDRQDRRESGVSNFGISKNSTHLTTAVYSLAFGEYLKFVESAAGTWNAGHINYIGYFTAADVIRPHDIGATNMNCDVGYAYFTVRRIW